MDPLTAVGIAGNIITFIDFSTKVVSRAKELHQSATGATAENDELEDLATNLKTIADRARYRPSGIPGKGHAHVNITSQHVLDKLSQQCTQVAQELLETLDSVKVQAGGRTRKSTVQAFKMGWKQDHIDSIQRRLDRISKQLMDGVTIEQLEGINRRLRDMAVENTRLQANRSDEIDQLRQDFSCAIDKIKKNVEEEQESSGWLILSDAAYRGQTYYAEQVILQSLRFSALDLRHQSIKKEHSQTFSWVFDDNASFKYIEWLRKEDGVFWISGKPGSGKSTLMKFISGHDRTKSNLQAWADDKKLIIASFYFWSASSHQSQKSQRGLLRTILYQILRQCPELIRTAYQDEWIAMTSDGKLLRETRDQLLTVPELLNTLKKISISTATDTKFCFFLDGLDEYDGRPVDIIGLVDILKSFRNVKACVASRPWNEFEDRFGGGSPRKLYMQNHTGTDIHFYVEGTLGANPRFQQLQKDDPECPDFVQNVVEAADGVFLWVFLVVRSLLEGLTNSDRIKDLQVRLDETPKDLKNYFQAMLFSAENRYRSQTAQILTIAVKSFSQLPLMAYWVIDQQHSDIIFPYPAKTPLDQVLRSRLDSMRRRLKVLSKCLLEVEELGPGQAETVSNFLFCLRVGFLHRTVKDYLQIPEAKAILQSWSDESFNADWEIFRSLSALAIMSPLDQLAPRELIWGYCHDFFSHAKRLDEDPLTRAEVFSMLDRLQRNLLPAFCENKDRIHEWSETKGAVYFKQKDGLQPDLVVISACTCLGMFNFVAEKFAKQPELCGRVAKHVPTLYWSTLLHAFGTQDHERSILQCSDTSMLQLLLAHGVNPNDNCSDGTEWSWILEAFASADVPLEVSDRFEEIKLLVKHGADLEQLCKYVSGDGTEKEAMASELLKGMLDEDEYSVIEDLANRRRSKTTRTQKISKKTHRLKIWIKSMR